MKNLFTYFAALIVISFISLLPKISGANEQGQCLPNQKCDKSHEAEEHGDHDDEHKEGEHSGESAGHHEEAEGHEEAERPSVGAGKAVEAADEHDGIKLSEKTIQFFKIRFEKPAINGQVVTSLPSALIDTVNDTSIYRRRAGWIKEIKVAVINRKLGQFRLIGKEALNPDDEIVVEKAAIVKLAALEASGASGDGHGH